MSFISLSFLMFFPVVAALYFHTPQRLRWAVLLFASCIFYMAFIPAYIFVLFVLIAIDYTVAIQMETAEEPTRLHLLWISIAALVSALFFFKYFNFFNANTAILFGWFGLHYPIGLVSIALPLGLSFHTFQSLSYVIEVYRGKQKAERHLGIYALYVMFYPQLVAGPIERPQHLLPQFYENHIFEYTRVKTGLIRMVWGFFKKMAVADNLSLIVNPVFANPSQYSGLSLLVASIAFTLQIYFDFSAYCDIALGAAQVMGFTLMENFNRPFAATSIAEFWRRWHISLSSWFRDYFYYPLTLSQKRLTPIKIYLATLFTFLVTGFWHGANWTFGVFGLLHGFYIVFGTLTHKLRQRLAEALGVVRVPAVYRGLQAVSIFALATLANMFFRSVSVGDAWYILVHIVAGNAGVTLWSTVDMYTLLLAFTLSACVLWCEYMGRNVGMIPLLLRQRAELRWSFYLVIVYMTLAFNIAGTTPFIYFQF